MTCGTDQSEDEEEEVEYYSDDGETEEVKMLQGRNKQLVVGYKGDRSYVVRGDKIGTFRHPGNNQVKYAGTLGKINDSKGKAFSPKHVSKSICYSRHNLDRHSGHVA